MNKQQGGNAPTYEYPWELPRFRNWVAVAKVTQLARRALSERLARVGLDLPHYEILAAVFRAPGLTQQELADKLLTGRSNLSMLLPELERRGLVDRRIDPHDKRVRRLTLTPEGEAQAREGLAIQLAMIEEMTGVLTEAECETLGTLARTVGAALAGRDA
jgi:DNA-binding MarR family transcriptional regulator